MMLQHLGGASASAAGRRASSISSSTTTTTGGRPLCLPLAAPAAAAAPAGRRQPRRRLPLMPPTAASSTTQPLKSTAKTAPYPSPEQVAALRTDAPTGLTYDAVVVGAGMGGLTAAAKMCEHGLGPVLVLEKYLVPGGSSARYVRDGYTFDVGSSMMFGMGTEGETNLITRALDSVGKKLETLPDPTQVHYHLPSGLEVRVWREYEDFARELASKFPHEEKGIRAFYGECWRVFNALNSLELKSLEEPRYLLQQFARDPLACLTLASFLITNCGDVARRHIKDKELLSFIDAECYIWSTVLAVDTPMVNAGMVFCDRHYGGINYPTGGVGRIGEAMAEGLEERYPFTVGGGGGGNGGNGNGNGNGNANTSNSTNSTNNNATKPASGALVVYKAAVSEILLERDPEATAADGTAPGYRACGVRLADGREFRARAVVSNATRWDTFERLLLRAGGGAGTGGGEGEAGRLPIEGAPLPPEAAEMRAASAALAAADAAQEARAGSGADASTSSTNGNTNTNGNNNSRNSSRATMPTLPATEQAFRGRFRKAPSFVSLHAGVDASVVPKEADVHHIVIEDWKRMEDPRGTLFVSVPTLLDPSLAPEGKHIVHAFTPDWIDSWSSLGPEEYEAEKARVAQDIVARLEKGLNWPGLCDGVSFLEVGTPRTHRRYLGRSDGSYGPIPARRPSGMLSMPFSTTSVPGLYCAGDSTFPGQGVNAAAFSAMAAAWRVAVDLGKQPGWPVLDRAYNRLLAWGRSLT